MKLPAGKRCFYLATAIRGGLANSIEEGGYSRGLRRKSFQLLSGAEEYATQERPDVEEGPYSDCGARGENAFKYHQSG